MACRNSTNYLSVAYHPNEIQRHYHEGLNPGKTNIDECKLIHSPLKLNWIPAYRT